MLVHNVAMNSKEQPVADPGFSVETSTLQPYILSFSPNSLPLWNREHFILCVWCEGGGGGGWVIGARNSQVLIDYLDKYFKIFLGSHSICIATLMLWVLVNLWHATFTNALSQTRMHSSGMRTACLLTVSQHTLCGGGGGQPSGCLNMGGVCPGGVFVGGLSGGVCPGGCVYHSMQWGRHPNLWTDRHLWKHNLHKPCSWTVIISQWFSVADLWRPGCAPHTPRSVTTVSISLVLNKPLLVLTLKPLLVLTLNAYIAVTQKWGQILYLRKRCNLEICQYSGTKNWSGWHWAIPHSDICSSGT